MKSLAAVFKHIGPSNQCTGFLAEDRLRPLSPAGSNGKNLFRTGVILLLTALLFQFEKREGLAQISDDIQIGGYVQGLPAWIDADLPLPLDQDSFWEYRLQNRLNVRWFSTSELSFTWQMRTRLFAGDLVESIPFYADAIDMDDGYFNLSWLAVDRDKWLLHYIPDRLYVEWAGQDWTIRAGRQRINWGINMVTNPNDIFNIYSFYDFDYPERPGTDAIRIQRYTGIFSRWELAASPARNSRESVAALMYGSNVRGYDYQLIAGYFRHRLATGGGWAGSVGESGFKGELMLFTDLEDEGGGRETNWIAALSVDHMFDNSLYLVVEGLYNHQGGREEFLLFGEPLSADNPSFSRFQLTGHATYPFSPIFNGSLALIWYPDEEAIFLSPSIDYSVTQNTDFRLLAQLFTGSSDSAFDSAGSVVAASLRWNF